MGWPAKGVCLLIRGYQKTLARVLGGHCRFYPSCSHYMLEAVTRHGVFFGVLLGVRRILCCHPWHPGGYDPVPTTRPAFKDLFTRKKRES